MATQPSEPALALATKKKNNAFGIRRNRKKMTLQQFVMLEEDQKLTTTSNRTVSSLRYEPGMDFKPAEMATTLAELVATSEPDEGSNDYEGPPIGTR